MSKQKKTNSHQYRMFPTVAFNPASVLLDTLANVWGFCRIVVKCILRKLEAADEKHIMLISLLKSEGVQQCHQLRTIRIQPDPGALIYCPETSATVKHGGDFLHLGAAFLHVYLENWSGLFLSSMLQNADRCLFFMRYHQKGVCLAPNLFCSRTLTPNIQPRSLRTISSIKKNKNSIIECVWDCTKRHRLGEADIHRRSVVISPG